MAAIESADYTRALRVWCDGYAAAGAPCATTVQVEHLSADDVLSRASDSHVIKMQPMPKAGGGFAYWENWSKILSDGRWDVRSEFRDDDEARRIAGAMLLTVFAHELGHHLAMRNGCHTYGMDGELLADELSTPLVQQLAHGRFGALHARMRATADAMIRAVPEAVRVEVPRDADVRAWIRDRELPTETAAYAALHLSRQRRLLDETVRLSDVAERRCLGKSRARLAQRIVEPGTVTTKGSWPLHDREGIALAIDRSGAVWAIGQARTNPLEITIRRVDSTDPARVVTLPDPPFTINTATALTPEHFVISDGVRTWDISGTVATKLAEPSESRIALDDTGTLWAGKYTRPAWSVGPVGRPRFRLTYDPDVPGMLATDASQWGDGPLDRALGHPWHFAVADDRVVFLDGGRSAIRAIGPAGVTTIAGSIEGARDGSTADAQFLDLIAVGVVDGGYAALERRGRHVTLRIIKRT